MSEFENLSLFAFKNYKNTLFASKLLMKLLAKMATKAHNSFASRFYSRDSHETLCMNFNVF